MLFLNRIINLKIKTIRESLKLLRDCITYGVNQDNNIKKLKELYKGLGYVTLFVYWRCFHTPYSDLEKLIPKKGKILDLGCGYGLFSNLLALTSLNREVVGCDICKRKLKYSNRNLKGVKFVLSDAFQLVASEKFDVIVMNHLLHHLQSYESQDRLLKLCYEALKEGGYLLILEIDKRPYLKFLFTQLVDNVAYFGDKFYYRDNQEFKILLENLGFKKIKIYPAYKKSLLSHVIISAQKLN